MILDNAPQDQAVMSNVGQIGEFTIRNSSKAFSILSSGLYANKVKAIIRELSCNAIDSHKAAGKENTKFSVHLPNTIEPHFSIRDYGIGLSHEQVTNLYTTYFESTKTMSNDFIGALGLGSKSPFSYTDNFTVIAVKDGRKGIYTAFINQEGVPSIALMSEEHTDELPGVEIKFSVNSTSDFRKFQEEAKAVYKWFKVVPDITGVDNFEIEKIEYETENIIPGVHSIKNTTYYSTKSYAVMGNIAYPIEIPEADTTINKDLLNLLSCGLIIEFGIGELDFQASREGLSYIPMTVESIKKKLEALNSELTKFITKEADAISNLWLRADYLLARKSKSLWSAATKEYVANTNFELVKLSNWGLDRKSIEINLKDLSNKYNIAVKGFSKQKGKSTCTAYKYGTRRTDAKNDKGVFIYEEYAAFEFSGSTYFVINDTKLGAVERAKYHWREIGHASNFFEDDVFVLEAVDKTKAINTEQFFKDIFSPPTSNISKASDLAKKERTSSVVGKYVKILKLVHKHNSWRDDVYNWEDAGDIKKYDANKTYYYVPLAGFTSLLDFDTKTLATYLKRGLGLHIDLYGVRKSDIEDVKKKANWVSIDVMIKDHFANLSDVQKLEFVKTQLDSDKIFFYNSGLHSISKNSPYRKFVERFEKVNKTSNSFVFMDQLYKHFVKDEVFTKMIKEAKDELANVKSRYPLLAYVENGSTLGVSEAAADYVNLIDNVKGV